MVSVHREDWWCPAAKQLLADTSPGNTTMKQKKKKRIRDRNRQEDTDGRNGNSYRVMGKFKGE